MGIVLEAGAEDLRDDGDNWEVLCERPLMKRLEAVKKAGSSGVVERVHDSAKLYQARRPRRQPD